MENTFRVCFSFYILMVVYDLARNKSNQTKVKFEWHAMHLTTELLLSKPKGSSMFTSIGKVCENDYLS